MNKQFLLDEILGIVDSQSIDMNTLCDMLEIDEAALLEAFKEKAVDNKEKFGIFDDIMDDIEEDIDEISGE